MGRKGRRSASYGHSSKLNPYASTPLQDIGIVGKNVVYRGQLVVIKQAYMHGRRARIVIELADRTRKTVTLLELEREAQWGA